MFRLTTFGESHGPALGCVLEGCPPRLPLSVDDLALDLARRRPGQSDLTTARSERDTPRIVSGVHDGLTTGTPIAILIENADARSQDYAKIAKAYRPSHGDFTYDAKYGHRDPRGGGRASARETAARVAAGAVARKLLALRLGVTVTGWVQSVGTLDAGTVDPSTLTQERVDQTLVRCPNLERAGEMEAAIRAARAAGDSLGGTVGVCALNVPPGWGEPVFDKLEARLAQAMLSIPAAKGFEIGSGFQGTLLKGSEHNDAFVPGDAPGAVGVATNHAGGVLAGISSGAPILARVAFKPTATIASSQSTVTRSGESTSVEGKGRHDPCVLPRAVPIVEAMMLLVLADLFLRHEAQCGRAVTGAGETAGDARTWSGLLP